MAATYGSFRSYYLTATSAIANYVPVLVDASGQLLASLLRSGELRVARAERTVERLDEVAVVAAEKAHRESACSGRRQAHLTARLGRT